MASLGMPAAYFTRFRRSSSTAASRRPSATMAAEALAWYALRPRTIMETGTASFARDGECFKGGKAECVAVCVVLNPARAQRDSQVGYLTLLVAESDDGIDAGCVAGGDVTRC